MTNAKLKLAFGITAAILLGSGATTMVISQTSNQPQILVKAVFVKAPTMNVGDITKEFAKPEIPIDPHSKAFHDLLAKHEGVNFLSSPTVNTGNGTQAKVFIGDTVKIYGTNVNVGLTFDVTPKIQRDSKIAVKIKCELRELISGASPSIRTTKIEEHIPPMSRKTIIIASSKIQDDQSETLLMFINVEKAK